MEGQLNYLLDTNVLLRNFDDILEEKKDCGLIISNISLRELGRQKSLDGELGYLARKALRKLEEIKKYGNISEWIKLPNNISIHIEFNFLTDIRSVAYDCNDDFILACQAYCDKNFGKTILVTNDLEFELKSEALGFSVENYRSKNDVYKNIYQGVTELEVDDFLIDMFYNENELDIEKIKYIPFQNEFVILKSKSNNKKKAITICIDSKLEKCKYLNKTPSGVTPRNLEQKLAIELLMRDEIPMVTLTGCYGSAKTFLELAVSLDKLSEGIYKKILLVKPPMPLDKNLQVGYKPGNVYEKYLNTLGSITSNLEALKEDKNDRFMNGVKLLDGYISQGLIEIISIEDILGSSYNNCIILAEEMQLLTKENMEALISRVGNSRIFINGDLKQGSRLIQKDPREMGLFHLIEVFKSSKLSGHMTLKSIQRSGLVKELNERW